MEKSNKQGNRKSKFNWKASKIKGFEAKVNTIIKEHTKNNPFMPLSKYRLLLGLGINPKTWKKDVMGDDVMDFKKKYEFIEWKEMEYKADLVDRMLRTEKGTLKLAEWELSNELENKDTNAQAIQININREFDIPDNIKIDEDAK